MPIAPAFDPTTGASGGAAAGGGAITGEPKLLLDWSPTGDDVDFDGSWGGTSRTIDGQSVKIFNRTDSGGATPTTSMIRLTAAGLRIQQTGGDSETSAFEFDFSSLEGMTDARVPRAVTMNFAVTTLTNAYGNVHLNLGQAGIATATNSFVADDVQLQAMRWSNGNNWKCRYWLWTAADAKTIYAGTNNTLGTSQPANLRLCVVGSSYCWWLAADTLTAKPGMHDVVAVRRILSARNKSAWDESGAAHPFVRLITGRGETTPGDVTLNNLRVWTFGITS